jgi:hypothetical protein
MTMNQRNTLISTRRAARLATLTALVGSFAAASMASAGTWSLHSGSICKQYAATDAPYLLAGPAGLYNDASAAKLVVCPIVRKTVAPRGAEILVEVSAGGAGTTGCNGYSNNCTSELNAGKPFMLASGYGSVSGAGNQSLRINLAGAGKSNACSSYMVFCSLGPDASIVAINLEEK